MATLMELKQERCVACRADSQHATDEEVAQLRPQVPEWELLVDDGIRKLRRALRFGNVVQALEFTNAVGNLAEAEGHHPLLETEWGRVTITWWTHNIRDLHRNDFIMSAKTDRLYEEMLERRESGHLPPKGS
jgi:4a-hydroxytetrahydrobiopterin dehydratase